MKYNFHHKIADSIREIIFGLEDGLVSTLGAVTGIAAGSQNTFVVILSGLVLIAVEASSMAAGSYLSSKSATAVDQASHKENGEKAHASHSSALRAGVVMGGFYFVGGFVPLTAYFFLPIHQAYLPSISATAIVLFLIGIWSAGYTKQSRVKSGLEMAGISLGAALIGFFIGRFVSSFFGIDMIA